VRPSPPGTATPVPCKQKGTCDHRLAIGRREIEARILEGPKDRLLAPDPVTAFVVVLDLSALRTSDRLNRSKFATSPAVVRLLGDRLIAGQQIDDSDINAAGAAQALAASWLRRSPFLPAACTTERFAITS
jgi:esterase/lipase superfamily enzyme